MRRHPGSTADEMKHFIKDSLNRFRPQKLIVFGGCNDIGRAALDNKSEWDVVNSVKEMAMEGRNFGCNEIYVSSILPRWGSHHMKMITKVNGMLRTVCAEEGLTFLDHGDITMDHICGDGIHPNKYGSAILKMNILSCFKNFNPYLTTFYDFYESAFS